MAGLVKEPTSGSRTRQDAAHQIAGPDKLKQPTSPGFDMLYKANTSNDGPAMIEGEAHPEDTARAVDAIRNLICREEGIDPDLYPETGGQPRPMTRPEPARGGVARILPDPAPENTPASALRTPAPAQRRASAAKQPATPAREPAQSGGFRPSWKLSGAIFAVATMLWRPWLIPSLVLLTLAVAAILWLSIGPDRASQGIAAWHARMARRNPARAETLRRFAARCSLRAERIASHLPDRWTRGLYFPDFEADTGADTSNPFERLVPQHRL